MEETQFLTLRAPSLMEEMLSLTLGTPCLMEKTGLSLMKETWFSTVGEVIPNTEPCLTEETHLAAYILMHIMHFKLGSSHVRRWNWFALMARLMGEENTSIHPNSPVWWKELDPCDLVSTHLRRKDVHPHTTPLFIAFHLTYTLYGQGDLSLMEAPPPLVVVII